LRLEPGNAALLVAAADAASAAGQTGKAAAYRLASGATAPAGSPPGAPSPSLSPSPSPSPSPTPLHPPTPAPTPIGTYGGDAATKTRRTDAPHLRVVATRGEVEEDAAAPITFADVGGMDDVKERLSRAFLQPLKNPEIYRRYGKRVGGGLVLYGPP